MLPRYYDLSEIFVSLKLAVVKVRPDGSYTGVTPKDNVVLNNNITDTFWSSTGKNLPLILPY